MYLIVGLGNPGEKYVKSRHNVGFIVLRNIVGDDWTSEKREKSLISHSTVLEQEVCYVLPQTFMNNSGLAVKVLQNKFGISAENIVVIHDDIDLPFGTWKIHYARGAGGHNGVQSVIDQIGTNEFVRVKVGIAPTDTEGKAIKPKPGIFQSQKAAVSKYVLKDFSKGDQGKIEVMSKDIELAIEALIKDGREKAMNRYN